VWDLDLTTDHSPHGTCARHSVWLSDSKSLSLSLSRQQQQLCKSILLYL